MNRPEHAGVGAAVGGVAYLGFCWLKDERPDIGGLLVCVGAGAAVACLPDLLEPAVHPNHRALIHSVVVNASLGIAMRWIWDNADMCSTQRILWMSLGLAYLSHPVLDLMTPKGLPFLL